MPRRTHPHKVGPAPEGAGPVIELKLPSTPEALVRELAPTEVRERFEAGVLPEEEFETAVRDVLFKTIESWPRWKKIGKHVVAQRARRYNLATDRDEVKFEKVSADVFKAEEWAKIKELKRLLPNAALEPFWIVATCGSYEKRFTKVAVRINFAGRQYVREVAL